MVAFPQKRIVLIPKANVGFRTAVVSLFRSNQGDGVIGIVASDSPNSEVGFNVFLLRVGSCIAEVNMWW